MLGTLTVITGCMFSGKTEELHRLLRREKIARKKFQLFKPDIDKRYNPNKVVSHNKVGMKGTPIDKDKPEDILSLIKEDTKVVGIDEAQFFGQGIVFVCQQLVRMGIKVYCTGLKQDFKGEVFGSMDELLILADYIVYLTAICNVCGAEATMTQRLINGVPAKRDAPQILVGGVESYQARCRDHHIVED